MRGWWRCGVVAGRGCGMPDLDLDAVSVRPIRPDERARFDLVLDEHHWLGRRLVGETMRYVALGRDGEWLAVLGFGAAALACGPRDRFIGWSDEQHFARLRYVTNNQRFCVLPAGRRKNLASNVLAKTLKRLSADFEVRWGHPVVMVETFVDPARHRGTCYFAGGFDPHWVRWRLGSLDSNRAAGLRLQIVGGLELDRWDIVEGAVQALMIEPVHPPEGGQLDVVDTSPGALSGPTDQLRLVQRVGGFGQRVVVAVPDRSDRGDRAELGESFAVADRGELAARVRVADQPLEVGAAGPAGHLERVQDHGGAHVGGGPPAHDHPRERVHDEAHVDHPRPRRHAREIRDPQGVGPVGDELAVDQIGVPAVSYTHLTLPTI